MRSDQSRADVQQEGLYSVGLFTQVKGFGVRVIRLIYKGARKLTVPRDDGGTGKRTKLKS